MCRKVPEDLQVSSRTSEFFTLATVFVMLFLIHAEYSAYVASQSTMISRVVLDSHQEDMIRINFNVSLPAIPCQYATVDIADHMGQRFTNITRHIRRFQLASQADEDIIVRTKEVLPTSDIDLAPWGGIVNELHEGEIVTPALTEATFDDFMMKYELVLVNYYAPWCPYSKMLLPIWEQTAKQLDDHPEYSEKVTMARVDCSQDDSVQLCRRARIHAFPSMMVGIQFFCLEYIS